MRYVEFGKTKETVSEMCMGTMMFGDRCDEAEADRILSSALDDGVNFIDTAVSYCGGETERILGRIMKDRRKGIFLCTKASVKVLTEAIDESLKRLQTDYVDLYLVHWPSEGMDTEEVMKCLQQIVSQGKARFVGCCNYPAWLFAHSNHYAQTNGLTPMVCNQIPYNLIERGAEVEVLPQATAEGIAIIVYRPLVMGLLAGKYKPGEKMPQGSRGQGDQRGSGKQIRVWLERYGDGITRLLEFARERDVSPVQVTISWIRHNPAVTCPIVGISRAEQVASTVKAFDFDLSEEEYRQVTDMFDTAVKEESKGDYGPLRRHLSISK